uniref:Uncharacterized protein n=1 Tax=Ditylenchus dipsaci TaxID=166011 RepID=A0A915CW64_9BILA
MSRSRKGKSRFKIADWIPYGPSHPNPSVKGIARDAAGTAPISSSHNKDNTLPGPFHRSRHRETYDSTMGEDQLKKKSEHIVVQKTMNANNFLRDGRLSMNAIGQAMGMDQQALMELVQIALNQLQVLPAVFQPAILVQQALEEIEEENDKITFVKSEKGKDKAVYEGFPFKQQRKSKDGSVQDWQCVNNVFLKFKPHNSEKSHNHALDPMAVPRSNVMANLKRRALDTRETMNSKTLLSLRIVLFGICDLAERSARNEEDGKWVFPVMYALLMNKSAASYPEMMELIKELWPLFNPASINMDFEQAAIQSAIHVFPEEIREVGLTTRYREPEFSVRARMIMSLAFVPPATIWNNFELLRIYLLDNNQDLNPVLNLFRRNSVGTAMNPPPFPANWWSCYERTLAGEDRTNNYAEAAHRRLQDALGVDHPTVGRLLQDLKRIQRNHDYAPKKRRIYLEADKRILAKVQLYQRTNLMEYLRGLAHNFVMDQ